MIAILFWYAFARSFQTWVLLQARLLEIFHVHLGGEGIFMASTEI